MSIYNADMARFFQEIRNCKIKLFLSKRNTVVTAFDWARKEQYRMNLPRTVSQVSSSTVYAWYVEHEASLNSGNKRFSRVATRLVHRV
jgi:hypothetical protein